MLAVTSSPTVERLKEGISAWCLNIIGKCQNFRRARCHLNAFKLNDATQPSSESKTAS
jgi:hypothetical protein